MDMQRIGAFLGHVERALSEGDLERTRNLTEEYLESEDFHSHVGLVAVEQIVPHPELLDLAETVIMKSIQENTVENGTAYDLISAEPTVWVVDRSGKIVAKYTGYRTGDEVVYQEELTDWLGRGR